jgi:hypothetical protein
MLAASWIKSVNYDLARMRMSSIIYPIKPKSTHLERIILIILTKNMMEQQEI